MFRYLNFKITSEIFVIVLLLFNAAASRAEDRASLTTFTSTDSRISNAKRGPALDSSASSHTEVHVKRDIKATDLKASSSASAKSYDPPPEFYRGIGSTSKASSSSTSAAAIIDTPYHRDSATASFISKPITFPDIAGHKKHDTRDTSQLLTNVFNNWQSLHDKSAQDRISVKQFSGGSDTQGLTSGYAPGGGAHYTYSETRPYSDGGHYINYGATHPTGGHYGTSGHGGYYGGANSAEAGAIPFDVYGGKGSGGHYAGAGGEYSYTFPHEPHEVATHKGHHDLSKKALLAKSFLIPLASAAVLGIAAALVSNPWLLQLGTVSGLPVGATVVGKRRRRRRRRDVASLSAAKAGLVASRDKAQATGKTTTAGGGVGGGAHMAYRAHRSRRMARV